MAFMKKTHLFLALPMVALLAACGGGDRDVIVEQPVVEEAAAPVMVEPMMVEPVDTLVEDTVVTAEPGL